jgi:hypothetical protein
LISVSAKVGRIIELGVGTCAFQRNLDWLELEDVILETRDALKDLNNAAVRLTVKKVAANENTERKTTRRR